MHRSECRALGDVDVFHVKSASTVAEERVAHSPETFASTFDPLTHHVRVPCVDVVPDANDREDRKQSHEEARGLAPTSRFSRFP